MMTRKYLPTLAELLDRLSIVLLKAIFIGESRAEYLKEIKLIESDINDELSLRGKFPQCIGAYQFRMVMMLMLANRYIWENEATTRKALDHVLGLADEVLADKLRATHSINGVRTTARNKLAEFFGERKDVKVDCLAADLPSEFGGWDVFD